MTLLKNILFSILFLLIYSTQIFASNPFSATVTNTTDLKNTNQEVVGQWLELKQNKTAETIFVKNEFQPMFKNLSYKRGENLLLEQDENSKEYIITDYYRQGSLNVLFIIFVLVVLVIGKFYGLSSLLGMAVSLIIILKIILPQIYHGANPITVVLLASIILIPLTFYLSHGINTKTNIAIAGTFVSAFITGFLAFIFTHLAHLNGFGSEEASFLDIAKGGSLNIQSLLIAGIIIGSIGILDDVSVSQVSVVKELKQANPKLKLFDLYTRSMSVGRDHVASMVNTLFLVYTGAALPLMLLFVDNSASFTQIINTEMIAEEVVRTLVASIGLILAVPITTIMAANYYSQAKSEILYNQENSPSHNHKH